MMLQTAIKVVSNYNKWRRDNAGKYEMPDPSELGVAIDVIIAYFKNKRI